MANAKEPSAKLDILIRRPVHEVFSAFTDPVTITKFWLARSSGPLAPGAIVEWEFMVPGARATTKVTAFETDRHIAIDWPNSRAEWLFTPHGDGGTILTVTNAGFAGSEAEQVAAALDATQGFTIVLCDLKVLLETGQQSNLTRDKSALIQLQQ